MKLSIIVTLFIGLTLSLNTFASQKDKEKFKGLLNVEGLSCVGAPFFDFYSHSRNQDQKSHDAREIRQQWVTDAPKTRVHIRGTNLMGSCANPTCDGKQWSVVCNQLGYGTHEIIRGSKVQITCKCIGCGSDVNPTTVAFNNCYYKIKSRNAQTGDKLESGWKHVGDECLMFDATDYMAPTSDLRIECKYPNSKPKEDDDF